MTRIALALLLLAPVAAPGAALAQSVGPNGVVTGQNWNMGQDLTHNENTGVAPGTRAADAQRKAARQMRYNQPITGVGRPATLPLPITR
jgi:hypothetical protein